MFVKFDFFAVFDKKKYLLHFVTCGAIIKACQAFQYAAAPLTWSQTMNGGTKHTTILYHCSYD